MVQQFVTKKFQFDSYTVCRTRENTSLQPEKTGFQFFTLKCITRPDVSGVPTYLYKEMLPANPKVNTGDLFSFLQAKHCHF